MIMTSFELFDNLFQTVVMALCAACAGALAYRRRRPEYVLLSLAYLCWMCGTLYWSLYLAVAGTTPVVFYVSELSWTAAYLFLLSVSILRQTAEGARHLVWVFVPAAALVLALTVLSALRGSFLFTLLFCGVVASMGAVCLCRLISKTAGKTPIVLLAVVVLQAAVYFTSAFTEDYSRFNAYFAVDILLTLTLAAILPALYREVEA